MADEKDPLAEVKAELDDTPPPENVDDSAPPKEEGKQGEELHAIDGNVKKLCEDVAAWKTETSQTLSELRAQTEALQQSIQQLSEKTGPEIVAIAPAPEPPPPNQPEKEGDRKEAKTEPEPKKSRKRFV